jgi:glycosyltransferase involved in cell wall biosynthesis
MTGGRRPRVLLIAELANPEWVSVPLEGWFHSRAIATRADVHLVTHERNRPAIEHTGLPTSEYTTIDSDLVGRWTERGARLLRAGGGVGWTTLTAASALPYYYFEHRLWRLFGERIGRREFDVVHRLTPLTPTSPSLIARRVARAGVPFVLGPLNGGLPWPKGFDDVRVREREWLSYVRGAYRLLPGYRGTRRYAAAIVAGSSATAAEIPSRYRDKVVYIPENAVDPARFGRQVSRPVALPIRLAFAGRLVPYKGADILVEAAADLVRAGRATLDIIGDGPEMPRLQELVARLGIGAGVSLPGWIHHTVLQERLVASDVFAFPSVREFGGSVVLEAMALGLVPVVVDYGGPGELVSSRTGFTVPIGRRPDIVAALRRVLERMVEDPSDLRAMGERARRRVLGQFTWSAKADQVLDVYRWVLGERDKPDFGMPLPDVEGGPEHAVAAASARALA